MDLNKIEQATRLLLEGLGVDANDHNFDKTPQRVAKVYHEMFCPRDTGYPVFDENYTDMVVMRGYTVWTMCPHHLLPVRLRVAVAYIPNGKVIGASKLIRMVHDANRYPMTQEALTAAVLDNIDRLTKHTSSGAAVLMTGQHGCFEIRGVKAPASMDTFRFSGVFIEDSRKQEMFMRLAMK